MFPGFAFQFVFSTFLEWMDRKFYARMQNRRGPLYTGYQGMLQPVADIFKLFFKEDIVPAGADRFMFSLMPILGLAAVVTAGLYIPVWLFTPYNSFEGDLIVVLYLLSIPSLVLFLAGWFSVSPFSLIGATRVLTQLFAYEVPFFLALLTPGRGCRELADPEDRRLSLDQRRLVGHPAPGACVCGGAAHPAGETRARSVRYS